jgi:UDP-glucose:(heptosyl)LPS alpha-1,3-glucosyltransferase
VRIALVLSHYFPHGGMQRDFLGIARELTDLGHHCLVYCQSWRGEIPSGIDVRLLPAPFLFFGLANHRRLQKFRQLLQIELAHLEPTSEELTKEGIDAVVGFEKMPGLDICFVPDACFVERAAAAHGALYRYTPRYRHFASWEKAVFDPRSDTHILTVSPAQQAAYETCYGTPIERMHTLPAGMLRDRRPPEGRVHRRAAMRDKLGLVEGELALLFVGSAFRTKGLDRAISALANLHEQRPTSRCRLLVVGEGRAGKYQKLARRLGVADKVDFLGGRTDVIALMSAADLMLHPARTEAGGVVLLEALVAQLPVIVSGNCGHAQQTAAARAGVVMPQPFEQSALDAALLRCMDGVFRAECRHGAKAYALVTDLYDMHAKAAQMIQTLLYSRRARPQSNA